MDMEKLANSIPAMAMPPKTYPIKIECSYCHKDMGIKDGGFKVGLVSHSICPDCMAIEMEKASAI